MRTKATSDVQLWEDLNHDGDMPRGEDFMEDFAHLIIAESEGYDICLVPNLWHVGGGKQGYWQVDKAMMIQTALLMTPKECRGSMDNFHRCEFIGNRLDPKDWVDSPFSIAQVGDSVVWKTQKLEYIARPPHWLLKGDHMGVQYDLTLGGIGTAIRSTGLWQDLPRTRRAGYDHCCWVEGSITVNGRKFVLENAYGLHERFTFGKTYDPVKNMAKPYNWVLGMSDNARIYFFALPGEDNIGNGQLVIDGEPLSFGLGEISVQDTETWLDPMTLMQVPVKWRFRLSSKDGVVDLDMAASGRGVFTVASRPGTTVRYSFCCQTNGQAVLASGRKIEIKNVMSYMEWGKTAFPLEAGI